MAKWLPGQSGNPGGLSVRQMRTRNMIEGLGINAVKRVEKLLQSENETVALGAAKLVLERVAPAPRSGSLDVKITDSSSAHLAALLALAERRKGMVIEGEVVTTDEAPFVIGATVPAE
jgi:hypothetical protein